MHQRICGKVILKSGNQDIHLHLIKYMPDSDSNPPYDSPKTLLQGIKDGHQKAKEQLFLLLHQKCLPVVKAYIIKSGGTVEDAEDFFQEAMIILFVAIESGTFKLNPLSLRSAVDQMCAYLMSVCKNLQKKEFRWRNRPPIPQDESEREIELDILPDLAAEEFRKMEKECQNLLTLFFHYNKSPAVIAGELKKTTENVKKQLAQCTDKLLESIGHLLQPGTSGELNSLVRKSMLDLEERCQQFIELFYFEKKNMGEIARTLGYANAHSATEQKSRCMRHLNRIVVSHLIKL